MSTYLCIYLFVNVLLSSYRRLSIMKDPSIFIFYLLSTIIHHYFLYNYKTMRIKYAGTLLIVFVFFDILFPYIKSNIIIYVSISIHLSTVYLSIPIYLSMHLYIYLSIYLAIYKSIVYYLSIYR